MVRNQCVRARGARCSSRLASADDTRILDKAVTRKARLQDTEGRGGLVRNQCKRRKNQDRARLCGVQLKDGEADSFLEFVSLCG